MAHRLGCIATTLALLGVVGISTAGTAAASPPDRFTMHFDETFLSGTSEDCGSDILLHVKGTLRYTDFVDKSGTVTRTLETDPAFFYTFSNAATGTSVTSRSPDSGHYTWNSDGSATLKVTGMTMHLAVPGSGGQAIQAGQFLITVDANGNITESEPVGANDDYHAALCEILSP